MTERIPPACEKPEASHGADITLGDLAHFHNAQARIARNKYLAAFHADAALLCEEIQSAFSAKDSARAVSSLADKLASGEIEGVQTDTVISDLRNLAGKLKSIETQL